MENPQKHLNKLLCKTYNKLALSFFLTGVELSKRKYWLSPDGATLNNRRGRFIVLGSSGECLPVTRSPTHTNQDTQEDSLYSSCNSSDDEFHSANDSFDYGESRLLLSLCNILKIQLQVYEIISNDNYISKHNKNALKFKNLFGNT